MRHISRSPAVRARAVRIADGKPVEGIDSVSFIQADSADTDEAPTVINTAKRTQVHTLETTKEINKAVLVSSKSLFLCSFFIVLTLSCLSLSLSRFLSFVSRLIQTTSPRKTHAPTRGTGSRASQASALRQIKKDPT